MKVNVINANHVELEFTTFPLFLKACFSYGRCAVINCDGIYYVNNSRYKYSTSTSRHINRSFPELRNLIKEKSNLVVYLDGDDAMDDVTYDILEEYFNEK